MCGDRNPLHSDPEFAAAAGLPRPILHGLCTYGMTCKAMVDALLDGDTSRVGGYGARFAGVVFPGETLQASVWKEGDRFPAGGHRTEPGRRHSVVGSGAGSGLSTDERRRLGFEEVTQPADGTANALCEVDGGFPREFLLSLGRVQGRAGTRL
jgi:MaoC like domain